MLTKLNQQVMIIDLLQDKVFCIAAMQLVAFAASAGARHADQSHRQPIKSGTIALMCGS
jgi:hypothetical protein